MTDAFARVALPLPLHNGTPTAFPSRCAARLIPGMRAVVPVRAPGTDRRRRRARGGPAAGPRARHPRRPRPRARCSPRRCSPPPEWVAGYYGAPLGLALRAVLPAAMWGESKVVMRLLDASLAEGAVAGELVRLAGPADGGRHRAAAARALGQAGVGDGVAARGARRARPRGRSARHRREAGERARCSCCADHVPGLLERDALFRAAARSSASSSSCSRALGGTAAVKELREREGFSDAVMKGLRGPRASRGSGRRSGSAIRSPASAARHRRTLPTAGTAGGHRRDRRARRRRGGAAAGRHRQRQDAGVSRGGAARPGRRARRDRPRPRDRAHAADREPLPRRLRRPGRGAAQRTLRRRARRCVAAAAPR